MDTDRRCTSNSTTTTSSELFICFTSRLSSSSSMKISSKSILSPGRGRDSSQISLSTSLSRRLRSSGSIKGGGGQASPMFPATNGKKRGCNAFENPEPSSPKVTCIGQVRVKTKKQGKKMRGRSKSGRREVSFRKTDQTPGGDAHFHQFQQQEQRNQRWVHLPVTICEALRAFGAEFNCFLPCRSSCMANNHHQRDKEEERGSNGGGDGSSSSSTSCGAVFARWLVAEKIELVVGEKEEEEDDDMMPRRSQRRHVFEDIVIEEAEKNEILDKEEEEEGRRVSICIPPKNALLLMRCRSDPVKMAALANRFWECPPPPDEAEEDNGGFVEEETHEQDKEMEQERVEDVVVCEKLDSLSHVVEEQIPEVEEEAEAEALPEVLLDSEQVVIQEEEDNQLVQRDLQKQDQEEDKEEVLELAVLEEETFESASSPEIFADPESEDRNEDFVENEAEAAPKQENEEAFDEEREEEQEAVVAEETETLQKMLLHEEKEEEEETVTTTTTTHEPEEVEPVTGQESKERASENKLPDCLLMMMCEPKLSMEVSKETWVCSTDFIRWHPPEKKPPPQPQPQPQPQPPQIVNKVDANDQPKKRLSIDLPPPPPQQIMQPRRSSCSFPAAPPLPTAPAHAAQSFNTMVDQKLVGVRHSYEPFVLTRCKSEPMRSSAKLAPDACFWKNRKLEPHRPAATLGVGAAGVGF